jgi:hypothetical protein
MPKKYDTSGTNFGNPVPADFYSLYFGEVKRFTGTGMPDPAKLYAVNRLTSADFQSGYNMYIANELSNPQKAYIGLQAGASDMPIWKELAKDWSGEIVSDDYSEYHDTNGGYKHIILPQITASMPYKTYRYTKEGDYPMMIHPATGDKIANLPINYILEVFNDFASVDLIPDYTHKTWVLKVNAGFASPKSLVFHFIDWNMNGLYASNSSTTSPILGVSYSDALRGHYIYASNTGELGQLTYDDMITRNALKLSNYMSGGIGYVSNARLVTNYDYAFNRSQGFLMSFKIKIEGSITEAYTVFDFSGRFGNYISLLVNHDDNLYLLYKFGNIANTLNLGINIVDYKIHQVSLYKDLNNVVHLIIDGVEITTIQLDNVDYVGFSEVDFTSGTKVGDAVYYTKVYIDDFFFILDDYNEVHNRRTPFNKYWKV